MAEVAAASSAAGSISLGLQVCGGIIKYYGDCKGQHGDIAALTARVEDLSDVMEFLHGVFQASQQQGHSPYHVVVRQVLSCEATIHELDDKLKKLRATTSSTNQLKKTAKDAYRKAMYPFRKPETQALNATLADLQHNLHVAISAQLLPLHAGQIQSLTINMVEIKRHLTTGFSVVDARFKNLETSHNQQPHLELQAPGARMCPANVETEVQVRKLPNVPEEVPAPQYSSEYAKRMRLKRLASPPTCCCRRAATTTYQFSFGRQIGFERTSSVRPSKGQCGRCGRPNRTHIFRTMLVAQVYGRVFGFVRTSTTLQNTDGQFLCRTLSCARNVSEAQSAAFEALRGLRRAQISARDLARVRRRLAELITSGETSPTDIKPDGSTLFHVSISSLINFCAHASLSTIFC
jgi:hypothetical protein